MTSGSSPNLSGYKLTFDDEFNSFSSNGPSNYLVSGNTGTWDTTYSYGERKLNDETELYSDPTIGVNPFSDSGGVLNIQAAPSTNLTQTYGQAYTSGVITTFHSFAQEYGYFEMRAELPQGAGLWPAFWMLPVQHVWPPELDPLEGFGAPNPNGEGGAYSFHSGLVTTNPNGYGSWNSTNGANLYTQYNTFGVDWEPNTITYYFNGHAYASIPTPSDFHQPMYLIANLAVGGNWAGPTVAETGNLKIDYIRAFSNTATNPAIVQQTISSPDGRGYDFYGATDANGNGALGVDLPPLPPTSPPVIGPAPTGTQTLGSGPDDLVLSLSEDAYQGDAQFILTVDGTQIGGTLSTSASHAAGATQQFDIKGTFAAGIHSVYVAFNNDYWGGGAGQDRNLYVMGATIDGTAIANSTLTELGNGPQGFTFTVGSGAAAATAVVAPLQQTPTPDPVSVTPTLGSGTDTLALFFAEDAWQGDSQFTVSVDGTQIGGLQTATASNANGQSQEFDVEGNFGTGSHQVSINYVNDAWGGSASTDRNLYLVSGIIDGTAVPNATLAMVTGGVQSFSFTKPTIASSTASASAVPGAIDPLVDPVYYGAQTGQIGLSAAAATAEYDNGGWQKGLNPDAWFDTNYYLAANPDVKAAGVNPLQHYEQNGWHEGRNPSGQFDTLLYKAAYPATASTNPLLQFIQSGQAGGAQASAVPGAIDPLVDPVYYGAQTGQTALSAAAATAEYDNGGWQKGLNPDAWFDTNYYLAANPDVKAAGVNPLQHYEQNGWHEGRNPSGQFDTLLYKAAYPATASTNPLLQFIQSGQAGGAQASAVPGAIDPLVDPVYYGAQTGQTALSAAAATAEYDNGGWQKGLNPDAWFDTNYYLAANPDVKAAGVNPLQHYEQGGWHEGRNPSGQFDTLLYQAAYPATASTDPLLQFIQSGQAGGAQASAVPGAIDPLVDPVYYGAQTGQTALSAAAATAEYDNGGWQKGLNPDAWFDTNYYLAANPDVRAAGVNPLQHYEQGGWHEGRNPSGQFDTLLYQAAYPATASTDPLLQFIQSGQAGGAQASAVPGAIDPLVDPVYYGAQTGQTALSAAAATAEYDNGGWQKGLNPDAWFDTNYYLAANPDVRAAGVNPLQHYEQGGWHEGRNPSAAFSGNQYLAAHPAVASSGADPLVQYLQTGRQAGWSACSAPVSGFG